MHERVEIRAVIGRAWIRVDINRIEDSIKIKTIIIIFFIIVIVIDIIIISITI